jgi:hypothetical protein
VRIKRNIENVRVNDMRILIGTMSAALTLAAISGPALAQRHGFGGRGMAMGAGVGAGAAAIGAGAAVRGAAMAPARFGGTGFGGNWGGRNWGGGNWGGGNWNGGRWAGGYGRNWSGGWGWRGRPWRAAAVGAGLGLAASGAWGGWGGWGGGGWDDDWGWGTSTAFWPGYDYGYDSGSWGEPSYAAFDYGTTCRVVRQRISTSRGVIIRRRTIC